MASLKTLLALVLASLAVTRPVSAGVVYGLGGGGLEGGVARWDASLRLVDGLERSLDGGLRYAVSGGSLQAFRDQFAWSSVPALPSFQTAVQQAFDAWGSIDPATQLRSPLSFVLDTGTAVAGVTGGGANYLGAEIDLIATNNAFFWDPGNTRTQGETWLSNDGGTVTLTSGVANYAHSVAISGVDIYINSNPGAVYTLDFFRRLLTHEIGHALGLGDVESSISPGVFIDDNFAGSATAATTLNNSWALLVNPTDPAHSAGLSLFNIGTATNVAGVNLLMESSGLGVAAGNPVTSTVPLTNDEYGTRQFLYPDVSAVPEAGLLAQFFAGLSLLGWLMRRRLSA